MNSQKKVSIIIMGAAGRDFHNFNIYFRDNEKYRVIAFTATQIPGIDNRRCPPELTGQNYPEGIPIYQEAKLSNLIKKYDVEQVIFGYSDVFHEYVMAEPYSSLIPVIMSVILKKLTIREIEEKTLLSVENLSSAADSPKST